MKYKIDKKNATCGLGGLGKWRRVVSFQAQNSAHESDLFIINHRVCVVCVGGES